VGDIERHHGDRNASAKHDPGGLRIDIDVELGRGRDVATFEIAAAHQHDLLNPGGDVRRAFERHGDVGERSERAKRYSFSGSPRSVSMMKSTA
jgi:hypothetical protein